MRRELKDLAIAVFVLTFAFGFNDKQPAFVLGYWLGNLVRTFFVVMIGVLVFHFSQRWMAQRLGFEAEFRLWRVQRLGWSREPQFPRIYKVWGKEVTVEGLPLGVILAVVLMLLTNGRLYFAAVSSFLVLAAPPKRLGKSRFLNPTDMDEAKIAAAGVLGLFALVMLFHVLNSREIFNDFILVYSVMTVFQLLPFPGLNGFTMLIASPLTYIFVALFALVGIVLLHFVNAFVALVLAGIVGTAVFFLYLWFRVYK